MAKIYRRVDPLSDEKIANRKCISVPSKELGRNDVVGNLLNGLSRALMYVFVPRFERAIATNLIVRGLPRYLVVGTCKRVQGQETTTVVPFHEVVRPTNTNVFLQILRRRCNHLVRL